MGVRGGRAGLLPGDVVVAVDRWARRHPVRNRSMLLPFRQSSRRARRVNPASETRRERRGIALFVSMFFVAGIGALALSAIYLTANATLLSKSYEKEDDLKYVSEAALQIGKS